MISFLTPYWSGREMMRIHLASIRRFYPTAPILVSKKGEGREEMEAHRDEFGIRYWIEECEYVDALLRLLQRCETDYVCIMDHDAVLLSNPDHLLQGLAQGLWNLVGIEERIREPAWLDWQRLEPESNGWFRFAPGRMDATFLMFNWREFRDRWKLRGIRGEPRKNAINFEYHHGICDKLSRHKYLRPFHTSKYGFGNLLKDGDAAILWHQWMGSYRTRLVLRKNEASNSFRGETMAAVEHGERAFLADYPALDLGGITPAWWPEADIHAEQELVAQRHPSFGQRGLGRVSQWRSYGLSGLATRALARLDRWRRLH